MKNDHNILYIFIIIIIIVFIYYSTSSANRNAGYIKIMIVIGCIILNDIIYNKLRFFKYLEHSKSEMFVICCVRHLSRRS